MPQTQTQTITIQGHDFSAPAPYAAGHVLTDNEAGALNALLGENLRNNFARRIRALKGDAAALTPQQVASLRGEFAEYCANYKIGTAQRLSRDPVGKEALRIATNLVRERLNAKGVARDDLGEGEFDAAVEKLAEHASVVAEAKRRVDATKRVAATALSILDDLPPPPAA